MNNGKIVFIIKIGKLNIIKDWEHQIEKKPRIILQILMKN